MAYFPIFLSVVWVVRNRSGQLHATLSDITEVIAGLVSDYEIIVVDNASEDDSIATLKHLTSPEGLPNLEVFALTKEVDPDTAAWVGLENALGDFVAVIDPMIDDIHFLSTMLTEAVKGADVVFAVNKKQPNQSVAYRVCSFAFNSLYKSFNEMNLSVESPQYRILRKSVVNFILKHPIPSLSYRHLPATGGFAKVTLRYSMQPISVGTKKKLVDSIDRGVSLLVSTTRGPMRLVSTLSLFGALANLVYSFYVIGIAFFKTNVSPGWVTLSLQQSGMFFLISLVLLVLGEYILHMVNLTNEGPLYHVASEFTSAVMTRREKLNIEDDQILNPNDTFERSS